MAKAKAYGQITIVDLTDVSIKETKITYQISNSKTVIPTGEWLNDIPATTVDNKYLWTKTVIVLTDNTELDPSYSVSSTVDTVIDEMSKTYLTVDKYKEMIEGAVQKSKFTTVTDENGNIVDQSIDDYISKTRTDIDGVTTEVSNVESTLGRNYKNLIRYAGFDEDKWESFWTQNNWVLIKDEDSCCNGHYALYCNNSLVENSSSLTQNVTLFMKSNTKYTLSFWLKSSSDFYTSLSNVDGTSNTTKTHSSTNNEWVREIHQFETKTIGDEIILSFTCPAGSSVYFSQPQLEEGEIATEFDCSDLDMQEQKATLKVQKDKISMIVESVSEDESGETSLVLTDKAIEAFSDSFIIKNADGETVISGSNLKTGVLDSNNYSYTDGNTFSDTGTEINLLNGLIRSMNFAVDENGNAYFKGDIEANSGKFGLEKLYYKISENGLIGSKICYKYLLKTLNLDSTWTKDNTRVNYIKFNDIDLFEQESFEEAYVEDNELIVVLNSSVNGATIGDILDISISSFSYSITNTDTNNFDMLTATNAEDSNMPFLDNYAIATEETGTELGYDYVKTDNLIANGGSIGNWLLSNGALKSSSTSIFGESGIVLDTNNGISLGSNFKVDGNGVMSATSGSFNNLQTDTGYYVHLAGGTGGSAGYVKIAQIKVTYAYANAPIRMLIAQRGKQSMAELTIAFANENSVDPALNYFYYTGEEISAYLYKSDTSTWDLYILKNESYDQICIMDFNMSTYMIGKVTVTWANVHQSNAISGWTQASTGGLYAGYGLIGGWTIGSNFIKSSSGSLISYELDGSKSTSTQDYYSHYVDLSEGKIIIKYNWDGYIDSSCYTTQILGGNIQVSDTSGSLTEINGGTINCDLIYCGKAVHASNDDSGFDIVLHSSDLGNRGLYDATNGSWLIYKDTSGNIHIPNGVLYLNGNIKKSSSSTSNMRVGTAYDVMYVNELSSKRFKHDITTDIDKFNVHGLYDVDVVSFKYNEDQLSKEDFRYDKDLIGFIAEDVNEKFPQAIDYDEDGNVETWNHRYMIPAMLKLIQEQKEEIDKLKEDVAMLKSN